MSDQINNDEYSVRTKEGREALRRFWSDDPHITRPLDYIEELETTLERVREALGKMRERERLAGPRIALCEEGLVWSDAANILEEALGDEPQASDG